METIRDHATNLQLVQRRQASLEQKKIEYFLYRIQTVMDDYWAVEVSFGRERSMQMLGRGLSSARRHFDQLVNGSVTPTTLDEVLSDFKRSELRYTNQ